MLGQTATRAILVVAMVTVFAAAVTLRGRTVPVRSSGIDLHEMTSVHGEPSTVAPEESRVRALRAELSQYCSPTHICLSGDERWAYVISQTGNRVVIVDLDAQEEVGEIPVGDFPAHAVLSADGRTLYVACRHANAVDVADVEQRKVTHSIKVGFEPTGINLSRDGTFLLVANTLSGTVSSHDVITGEVRYEVPVGREPRYLFETPDGSRLVVGNAQSRDAVILDAQSGEILETRSLGRTAQLREGLCTADGRWCIFATTVGHDEQITIQMERGWINSNGLCLLDLEREGRYVVTLLDRLLSGATNPWSLAISSDERRLYVTLAGIHQVALVDLPALLQLAAKTPPEQVQRLSQDVEILERLNIARRVDCGGIGPRGLALAERRNALLVANYFSDTLSILDADTGALKTTIPLGSQPEMTPWRRGQMYFCDGRICFQNWYSCASCHQEDATVDSLNWDLINDGMGNPKNAKSMHDGIMTPPAMWSGVREDQYVGVMAGQRFLGFLPDMEIQADLMEFIGNPLRAPNPYRKLDPAAIARGKLVFYRARCNACHPSPVFSDRRRHDIGLTGYTSGVDFRSRFDTPALLECYRTGPYLHDGRAATLLEIFTDHNPHNTHGLTKGLSLNQLHDLVAYLRSL